MNPKIENNKKSISIIGWGPKLQKDWQIHKVKYLLESKITDGPHETPEFIDEGIPFLSVDSIQDGKLDFENCRYISKEDYVRFKVKCNPRKNDVLMGKAASIGKIAIVDVDFDFGIWSPLALIRPHREVIVPKFLEYSLKTDYCQDQIDLYATSNTQKNISMDDIPRIQIITPPIPEQISIASFLDKKTAEIGTLIDRDRRLIDLLREKRSSLINHAVTKGLDPKAKMKDSGVEWIGEIPEGWDVRKLSYCFDIIGSGTTPSSDDESYYMEGTIPWIITGDLNDSILEEASKRVTESAFHEHSALKMFPKNSIIIAMYGATIGKLAITTFDACTNQACCVLTKSKIVDIKFLFYWFLANRNEIISRSYGGGQPNISQEVIRSLKIQVPPIQQQIAIVAYLDKQTTRINSTVSKIETKIALLLEYKKSLIHHAVTGAIMVPS